MLLHTVPQLLTATRLGSDRRLVDVVIPEIGLELRNGREVTARTPYPNKSWMLVGRRGNPPTDGLLIDVGDAPDALTVRTRWAVGPQRVIAHELRIIVADRRHEVIAAHSTLWSRWGNPQWRWDDVQLPWMEPVGTIRLDAFMPEGAHPDLETVRGAEDVVEDGVVTYRHETLEAPSVEWDRYEWIAANSGRGRSRIPVGPINR